MAQPFAESRLCSLIRYSAGPDDCASLSCGHRAKVVCKAGSPPMRVLQRHIIGKEDDNVDRPKYDLVIVLPQLQGGVLSQVH